MTSKFSDRIRFNWGYQDGVQNRFLPFANGVTLKNHFDRVYAHGFRAGQDAYKNGHWEDDSTIAWITYKTEA